VPKITLPRLPSNGDKLLSNGSTSDPGNPYTVATYDGLEGDFDLGAEKGLMSTLNGRLNSDNLDPQLQIQSFHIQPEQASLARSDRMLPTATIYGNGVPEISGKTEFFTLPGCSVRWYQPYGTTATIMQWSLFLSYNVWRGVYKDMLGEVHSGGVTTAITLRCAFNGVPIQGSERKLGHNMFHPISPAALDRHDQTGPGIFTCKLLFDQYTLNHEQSLYGWFAGGHALGSPTKESDDMCYGKGPPPPPDGVNYTSLEDRGGNPQYVDSESHTAVPFDMHHVAALEKGWNEISIEAAISQPAGAGVYLQNVGKSAKSYSQARGYLNLIGKLSLGIRNARVLNLL